MIRLAVATMTPLVVLLGLFTACQRQSGSDGGAAGMGISPLQPADNVFISIPSARGAPGAPHHDGAEEPLSFPDGSGLAAPNTFVYQWTVPARHPLGPHWYHPHAHGMVESQVLSSLSSKESPPPIRQSGNG